MDKESIYERKLYDFTRLHNATQMSGKNNGFGYYCTIWYKNKEIKRTGVTKADAIRKALEKAESM
jgi:hypothetical protein